MPPSSLAVEYRLDPFPADAELARIWTGAWGSPWSGNIGPILERSLVHVCAYDAGQLVGFVNVAWDGGVHAFLLDTTVAVTHQRRGIAQEMVRRAAEASRERGAQWLHVDYEAKLDGFYKACGFRPTLAGLIRL
jgi:ribosomal protein S18 acetylase RimI-like enzyme